MTSGFSGSAHSLFRGLGNGSRLAGYLVEEQIGTGGMAVVFRARDEVLGRLAAIKVIAPSLADDEEFRARFLRESRAAAAVDSLHILPVYGAGETEGLLYIATRFVAGGDLAALLRRSGGRLSPERAAALVAQVASALDAAHAAGLVHRDVKPQNILIDALPERPEHAYLSDFGLSRTTASTGLTASGQFLGTPDYCAPEQVKSARVDGRADQYALGCVAFALLTGTAPFHREETLGTLFAHVQDPVPPVTGLRPELPPAVDGVIARALAKSPEGRYARCGELATALQEALAADRPATVISRQPSSATPDTSVVATGYADTITAGKSGTGRDEAPPRPARDRSLRRGKARAIWATSAAVVLAAGALAVALLHHSPPASPGQATQGPSHRTASTAASRPGTGDGITSRVLSGGSYSFNNPEAIASDGAHIWVANWSGNSVTELSATDGTWIRTLSGGKYGFSEPDGIAFDGAHIWVTNAVTSSVTELNASDGSLVRTLTAASYEFNEPDGIAFDGSHIWVANYLGGAGSSPGNGLVTELNASDGSLVRTITSASYEFNEPYAIAAGDAHIWVVNRFAPFSVTELNASDGSLVRTLTAASYGFNEPYAIAFDGTHVWVANLAGSVTELNASDGSLVRTLSAASYGFNGPYAITAAGTRIWVANKGGSGKPGSVTELNASDGSLVRTLTAASYGFNRPYGVAAAGGHVWVANAKGNSVTELTVG